MASYYARPKGSDLGGLYDGLSDTYAFQTLGVAQAAATTAGDIIYLANGFDSAGEILTAGESIIVRAYRSTEDPSDVPPAINGALDIIGETWTNVALSERIYFDLTAGSGHANDNIAYLRFKCYALQIHYTGAAATAAAAITSTGVTLTTTTPAATHTFTFASYPTLGALVTAMHALTDWTCTRPFMASDYPSSGLAAATHANVKTEAVRFAWTPGAAGSGYIGGKEVTTPAALGEFSIATDGAAGTRVTIYVTDGSDEAPTQDFVAVEVFWSDHAVIAGNYNVTMDGITLKGFGGYTASDGFTTANGACVLHNCIVLQEAKVAYSRSITAPQTVYTPAGVFPCAGKVTGTGSIEAVNNTVIGGYHAFAAVGTGAAPYASGNITAFNNLLVGIADYPLLTYGTGTIVHGDNRVYGWFAYSGKSSIALTIGGTNTHLGGDTWDDDPRRLALGPAGWEWPAGMANVSLDPTYPYTDAFDTLAAIQRGFGPGAPLAIGALPSGEGWTGGLAAAAAGFEKLVAAGSEVVSMGTTRQCYADAATLIPETTGAFAAFTAAPGVAFTLTTTWGTTSATMTIDQTAGTLTTLIDANPAHAKNLSIDLTTGGVFTGHSAAVDGYMTIAELVDTLNDETGYTATLNQINTQYLITGAKASCACLPDQGPTDISTDSIQVFYTGSPDAEISKVGDDVTISLDDCPVMSLEYTGTASAATATIGLDTLVTDVTAEEVFDITCTAGTSAATAATMTVAANTLTTSVTEAEAFALAYAGAATTMTATKAATSLSLNATAGAMDFQYVGAATTAVLDVAANHLTTSLTGDAMDLQYVGAATTALLDVAANHLTVGLTGDAMDLQYVGNATTCVLDVAGSSLTSTATANAMTLTYGGAAATATATYTAPGHLTTDLTTAPAFNVEHVGSSTSCLMDIVAGTSFATTLVACPAIDIDYTGAAAAGTVTVGGGFIRGDTTASVDDFFFSLLDLTTLTDVVDAINALGNWTAALNVEGKGAWASGTLDLAGLVDAKGATAVLNWSGQDLLLDLTNASYDTIAELVAAVDDGAVHYTATITHADYNLWPSADLDAIAAHEIEAAAHDCTWSGTDLDLDLTGAANDTIAELCAVIHAKDDYTCVIGNAEFNNWPSDDLDDMAAADITVGGHVCTWTGLDLDVDLTAAATDTFSELVGVLDALAGYTCTIGAAEFNTWASTNLDAVAAQDLVAGAYTCTFAGMDVDLDLTDAAYDTFAETVAVLDALAGYTCTIGNAEFNTWLTTTLDAVAAQDLVAGAYTLTFEGTDIDLDLTAAAYDTVVEVVAVLDALAGYTCTIGNAEFNAWLTTSLDAVAAQDVKGAPYTCTWAGDPHTYDLTLAANDTVAELVALLNALTGVTCTITHADYNAWPTTSLVAMAAQDITGAGHTALYTGQDLSYDLTAGTSDIISEVVALIHAKQDYTCTIAHADFNARNAALLDAIAGQDILTAAHSATWSGTDLTYDLTAAASDTVGELATLINAKSAYTSAILHADHSTVPADALDDITAEDITSSVDLEASGFEFTFDVSTAPLNTYAELTAAIDGMAGMFLAIVTPGTVGTDASADLADFTATGIDGSVTLATNPGTVVMDFASVFANEFEGCKDWLDTNVTGSHGEILLWPFNWRNELAAAGKVTIDAAASAAGFTLARGAYPYLFTGNSNIATSNAFEAGHDVYNVRGVSMSATTPQAADDHVKHLLTWARVNGFPLSFLGHYTTDDLDPDVAILDAYVQAIKKYGRYTPFTGMLGRLDGTVRNYQSGRADMTKALVPAPQAFSSLVGEGRIIAGVHAVAGHVDALAQTGPRLQAQAFGFRTAGETEWSAQRKIAFFVSKAGETIEISKWAITPSASGAQSLTTYDTIGDVIDRLIALGYTVLTHVQCIRSLPSTHLELVTAGTSIASGLWIHYYPAAIQPSIGAIERVVKLGQPKESWRR